MNADTALVRAPAIMHVNRRPFHGNSRCSQPPRKSCGGAAARTNQLKINAQSASGARAGTQM